MGSAVTTLNRYTKTIIEFKFKRRNIEKSLLIKQKLMELHLPELHLPEQGWDLYLSAPPTGAELSPPANGHKPPTGTFVLEMDEEHQGEEYC